MNEQDWDQYLRATERHVRATTRLMVVLIAAGFVNLVAMVIALYSLANCP